MKIFTINLFVLLCIVQSVSAQNHWYVDSILTRDGKKLAADIYLPDTTGGQTFPTILVQTPYNRQFYRINLPLGFGTQTQQMPFAFVVIDWRCFYGSLSACTTGVDRGKDGYDVVEWIASQTWSDGKVGTWGPSALGRIQYLTAKEKPPHLVCAVPLVAGPQYNYQEYYPGGVLRKEYVETLDALGFGLSSTILAHQVFDVFWQYSENSTFYPSAIEVPMLLIGGWYDHNIDVMHDFFKGLKQSAPVSVRDKHKLLFGPWAHGGFGTAQVGTGQQGQLFYPGAAKWSDSLALMFFDYYLRDIQNGWDTLSDYVYFQMGDDNWLFTSSFPPQDTSYKNFYLQSDGLLTENMPTDTQAVLNFIYNPSDPSPTVGGATLTQGLGQGPYDQAPAVESRNDILVFTTEILQQNLVVKGKPSVKLKVSSDRPDTDFTVRLTDVYPDGRSMLLLEGIRRMRFRNGYTAADTAMMSPTIVYEAAVELPYTAHTFLQGHKMRVDIASANYPRFAMNLNNGGAMYVAGDTLSANNSVYVNAQNNSYISLPLVGYISDIEEISTVADAYWQLFPNPCNGIFQIKNSKGNENLINQIQITDVAGRILYLNEAMNIPEAMIDIQQQTPGFYMVKLTDNKGLVSLMKLIIKNR